MYNRYYSNLLNSGAFGEPYRQALILTEYQGLSQKQLAEQVGISLSGAKSRVQRARDKLRDMLLRCYHFEFDRRGHFVEYYERCCCCHPTTAQLPEPSPVCSQQPASFVPNLRLLG